MKYKMIKNSKGYRVSENGIVSRNVDGKWRELNPSYNENGHPYVNIKLITEESVSKRICVLVHDSFISPVGKGRIIHKDGNVLNNHISNLLLKHISNEKPSGISDTEKKNINFDSQKRKYVITFVPDNKKINIGEADTFDEALLIYTDYLRKYTSDRLLFNKRVVSHYLSESNNVRATANHFGISTHRVYKIIHLASVGADEEFPNLEEKKESTIEPKHVCELEFSELPQTEQLEYYRLIGQNGIVSHRDEYCYKQFKNKGLCSIEN